MAYLGIMFGGGLKYGERVERKPVRGSGGFASSGVEGQGSKAPEAERIFVLIIVKLAAYWGYYDCLYCVIKLFKFANNSNYVHVQ